MNEDTNPFVHSYSSHLFGASVWIRSVVKMFV